MQYMPSSCSRALHSIPESMATPRKTKYPLKRLEVQHFCASSTPLRVRVAPREPASQPAPIKEPPQSYLSEWNTPLMGKRISQLRRLLLLRCCCYFLTCMFRGNSPSFGPSVCSYLACSAATKVGGFRSPLGVRLP